VIEQKNIQINNKEIDLGKNKIKSNAYWIKAELIVQPNATAGFKIAQKKDASGKTISETVIGYDAASNQLYVDRTNSGGGKVNEQRLKQEINLQEKSNKIQLEILFDKSSLEVFVNNGEGVITTYIYPDEDATNFAAFANNGSATISSFKTWDMSSVKNEQ
jgi:levanase/fructan beta-fructosidase